MIKVPSRHAAATDTNDLLDFTSADEKENGSTKSEQTVALETDNPTDNPASVDLLPPIFQTMATQPSIEPISDIQKADKSVQVNITKKKSIFKEDLEASTQTEHIMEDIAIQTSGSDPDIKLGLIRKKLRKVGSFGEFRDTMTPLSLDDIDAFENKIVPSGTELKDYLDSTDLFSEESIRRREMNTRAFFENHAKDINVGGTLTDHIPVGFLTHGQTSVADDSQIPHSSSFGSSFSQSDAIDSSEDSNQATASARRKSTQPKKNTSASSKRESKGNLTNVGCQTDQVMTSLGQEEEQKVDIKVRKTLNSIVERWKRLKYTKSGDMDKALPQILSGEKSHGVEPPNDSHDLPIPMAAEERTFLCLLCQQKLSSWTDEYTQTIESGAFDQGSSSVDLSDQLTKATSTSSLGRLAGRESPERTKSGLTEGTHPGHRVSVVLKQHMAIEKIVPLNDVTKGASLNLRDDLKGTSTIKSARKFAPESTELGDILAKYANTPQRPPRTKQWIKKFIKDLYTSKQQSDSTSDLHNIDHMLMPHFFLLFLKNHYGTRKLVEQQCMSVIQTTQAHRTSETIVDIFARFLDESWNIHTLNAFLKAITFSEASQAGNSYPNYPLDSVYPRYICFLRCEDISRRIFGERHRKADEIYYRKLMEKAITTGSSQYTDQKSMRPYQKSIALYPEPSNMSEMERSPSKILFSDFLFLFSSEFSLMHRDYVKWQKKYFDEADKDSDGYITYGEFTDMIGQILKYPIFDQTEVQSFWKRYCLSHTSSPVELMSYEIFTNAQSPLQVLVSTFRRNWIASEEQDELIFPKFSKNPELNNMVKDHWVNLETLLLSELERCRRLSGLESECEFLNGLQRNLIALLNSNEDGGKAFALYRKIMSMFGSLIIQGHLYHDIPANIRDEDAPTFSSMLFEEERIIQSVILALGREVVL